jgi:hypothetical protein
VWVVNLLQSKLLWHVHICSTVPAGGGNTFQIQILELPIDTLASTLSKLMAHFLGLGNRNGITGICVG